MTKITEQELFRPIDYKVHELPKIVAAVAERLGLNPRHRQLLLILMASNSSGWSYMTTITLGKLMGIGDQAISINMSALVEKGVITRRKRMGTSSITCLLPIIGTIWDDSEMKQIDENSQGEVESTPAKWDMEKLFGKDS